MSSNHIYPYVYQGTNPDSGEFYIGMRCANKLPSHKDLPRYRTSSNTVKPRFDEFKWIIVAEFFTKEAAYDFEQELIHERWGHPLMLNKVCSVGYRNKFILTEEARVKKNAKLKGHVVTPETRSKISEARKGVSFSASHKESLRLAALKRFNPPKSDDHKRKISKSHLGTTHTEESKEKMRQSAKRRWATN